MDLMTPVIIYGNYILNINVLSANNLTQYKFYNYLQPKI